MICIGLRELSVRGLWQIVFHYKIRIDRMSLVGSPPLRVPPRLLLFASKICCSDAAVGGIEDRGQGTCLIGMEQRWDVFQLQWLACTACDEGMDPVEEETADDRSAGLGARVEGWRGRGARTETKAGDGRRWGSGGGHCVFKVMWGWTGLGAKRGWLREGLR